MKDITDGKLDSATKEEIEQAIKETKEALAGDDIEEIKRKQEALLTASHKLSEALYQQAQQQEANSASATDDQSADDVVEDAEIIDDEDEERRRK
jgi:molecular chaperone DnaK